MTDNPEPPESENILPVMVGTAGHVDHGKTSLVKHLTGIDTDQLKEEKARGLSIDLGFASCTLKNGKTFGIIDVPGHEHFIRNMVAGAATIDLLLLVIAADDGIMPQTREHMLIAELLGMSDLMIVLTKKDLVDPDWLELVRDDIRSFAEQAGYPKAPILTISNTTGEGIKELQAALAEKVESVRLPVDDRAFRVNIARVLSIKGYGTVCTGVPLSGKLEAGEELELLPRGRTLTVRDIQNYHQQSGRTRSHRSSAMNLRDLDVSEVHRGMTLAVPGIYQTTKAAVVWVRNASDRLPIKGRPHLKFHAGTASIECFARVLGKKSILPGEEGFLKLTFRDPVVIAAGDRFVLRRPSPSLTFGGGRILSAGHSPSGRLPKGFETHLPNALQALRQGDLFLAECLAGPCAILSREEACQYTQLPPGESMAGISLAEQCGDLVDLSSGSYLVASRKNEVETTYIKALDRYHKAHPYTWGISSTHAVRLIGLHVGSFRKLCEILIEGGQITVKHGHLALKSYSPKISARQMKQMDELMNTLIQHGVSAPA
ncbi:MAG TPA: selenocysteine-specific translation elongation factor, partial [Verrucomicrobiales bacterium]|nr:selenocysteine-specific translation elongation factor [Verrucomicrobiales bacterium]